MKDVFSRFPEIFNPYLIEYIENELNSSSRHWHGMFHHNMMLESNRKLFGDNPTLALATVFHDLIYDPTSKNNEEESARIATMCLWHTEYNDDVNKLIMCSIHHNYSSDLEKNFCHLDLEIFSKPTSIYKLYANGIRKEYSFVSNEDYREGRKNVLNNLKEPINELFGTIDNIEWEISELSRGTFDILI